jgi:ribosomal protein S18 acetylase RimI-like enzyme
MKLTSLELEKNKLIADIVLQLINTHRAITLSRFLNEVDNADYLLQFNTDNDKSENTDKSENNLTNSHLVGMLRYYPMTAKYLLTNHISKTYAKHQAVSSVIVSSKYRGKGYGKKLMNKLYSIVNKPLFLDTYMSWNPAVKLYLSVGFTIVNSYKIKSKTSIDYILQFVKK